MWHLLPTRLRQAASRLCVTTSGRSCCKLPSGRDAVRRQEVRDVGGRRVRRRGAGSRGVWGNWSLHQRCRRLRNWKVMVYAGRGRRLRQKVWGRRRERRGVGTPRARTFGKFCETVNCNMLRWGIDTRRSSQARWRRKRQRMVSWCLG